MSDKHLLRTITRGVYDLQKLRIQMGNRIVGNFKAKLGQAPGKKEDDLDAEDKRLLDDLRVRYRKITDGIKREIPTRKKFKGDEVISTYTELVLLAEYIALEEREVIQFRTLEGVLTDFPIYDAFLHGVRGCGHAMSAVIISEFDITKAEYPSSLWAYAGFDVGQDGRGRSRRKEHLVKKEYVTKDGDISERDSITFNPWLKTKLYVLATCLIKAGGTYKAVYDGYKNRLENHPNWVEKTKGHRHAAAMRFMIKRFLVDLYNAWRPLEGLPVAPEYSQDKLGMEHKKAA